MGLLRQGDSLGTKPGRTGLHGRYQLVLTCHQSERNQGKSSETYFTWLPPREPNKARVQTAFLENGLQAAPPTICKRFGTATPRSPLVASPLVCISGPQHTTTDPPGLGRFSSFFSSNGSHVFVENRVVSESPLKAAFH